MVSAEVPDGAVVVGADNSPAGTAALRWAASEAARRDATLRVVRVHDTAERADLDLERDPDSALKDVRRRLFAQVCSRLQPGPHVWVVVTAVRGRLVPSLAREARGASTLVVGEPANAVHRDLPDELSRRCGCPVAVVAEDGEARYVFADASHGVRRA